MPACLIVWFMGNSTEAIWLLLVRYWVALPLPPPSLICFKIDELRWDLRVFLLALTYLILSISREAMLILCQVVLLIEHPDSFRL